MSQDQTLHPQRTVLMTGCSTGIGAAAARSMRARGWRVFPAARQQADVDALKADGFEAFRLDYEDAESIKAAVEDVLLLTGGKLDAVFNNGAYAIPGALEDLPADGLRALFEANFIGWHDLTRQVLPVMRAQGSGRIVQCSSVLGFIAMKYRGAYTASKFALEAYSDTLRQELKGSGIHVSLIEPGPIETNFTKNALANFDKWIGDAGTNASVHRETYRKRRIRMEDGERGRFKLPPDAVVKRLIHALEAQRPKSHYHVTVPTHLLAVLKRILPVSLLDRFLISAADAEE
ncbi:SDR family oxidoreductase [Roseibium sp. RKSG952]|uniref:SDR family oxidoreductase n=1 Tax=Roseibium sp. RKSG952 TaxID=2529384 RepID=UPI0012BBF229|nr:SDR family oxidoreductase [Roseibium sp. RKSG952]MTI01053.1 SDR family oxidoreductase [Roseibium sp. RKSG952]